MTGMPRHLLDESPRQLRERLRDFCAERGEPAFRSTQISRLLLEKRRADPSRMASLPRRLREELAVGLLGPILRTENLLHSRDGTRKFRFRMVDGADVESVWIPTAKRVTLCISSQAGCPAACTFCATGASGFRRNLEPKEILAQWLQVAEAAVSWSTEEITQIVFMGMGEPLLNYGALRTALRLLTTRDGFGFSPRRVTVSTVGIPPRMRQLIGDFPQVRLALSLHSARDVTRAQIVPLNRKYPIAELKKTLAALNRPARRVTLEVVHLSGVNDSREEARALADFAGRTDAHVNLIPFHPFPGAPYAPSRRADLERFRDQVCEHFRGRITIRRSRGLDIAGACGQLALPPRAIPSS